MAKNGALVEDLDEEVEEPDIDNIKGKADGADVEARDNRDSELEADVDPDAEDTTDDEESSDSDDEPMPLDALEAEELEIVESDKSATMLVDEASEIMAIRRAELSLGVDADGQRGDEFVCQSCFLVLKSSQLANKRKMLCVDCA